jgi:nucleotide-binding universal stress UspA family protein
MYNRILVAIDATPVKRTGPRKLGLSKSADRNAVQALVGRPSAAGIEAHGEIVSATTHDVARVILQRAQELNVDLLVLGHQQHRSAGNAFRSSVADWIIHHHPPFSNLLDRPPARA